MNQKKYVYSFGGSFTEGDGSMKNLLGGKGANLAEMANLGLPVPPGFTVTTECCVDYFTNNNQLPQGVEEQVKITLQKVPATKYISNNEFQEIKQYKDGLF